MIKLLLAGTCILLQGISHAQKFDGFVITTQDSLLRGYMRISLEGEGRKILITDDKKKQPKSFYLRDLKYYCYKNDTAAILSNFYPFEGESFQIETLEAKIIIGRGKLKLYYASFPEYRKSYTVWISVNNGGITGAGAYKTSYDYTTYVIKDRERNLIAIKKKGFVEQMAMLLEDNQELVRRIESKELRYRDTEEIIRIYNRPK